ncbi:MAG: DUF4007 family protein [Cyclobacteriaceae bacterium]
MNQLLNNKTKSTFSGHDSFQCRNLWLKKGYDYVKSGKSFNDNDSVVVLGVGKNMVSSIRFWMKAFGILEANDELTEISHWIFDEEKGFDPYLEDEATLWILHYLLVKGEFATTYSLIFNFLRKEKIEFTRDNYVQFVQRVIGNQNENTLNTDFNVFVRMYLSNNGASKDKEDNLMELLNELRLVESYKSEKKQFYVIENQERTQIPEEVLLFSIMNSGGFDISVNLKSLESDYNSVGNIFAISRYGLLNKILALVEKYDFLIFNDQAGIKELQFRRKPTAFEILKYYYEG